MKLPLFLMFICALISFTPTFGQQNTDAPNIIGDWSIANNQIAVTISKNGDRYQGRIIWLNQPNDANGLPKLDKYNLDREKRRRPLLNSICLYDFEYNPTLGVYENGFFYNPLDGNTIKATLKVLDNNRIEMTGFSNFSLKIETEYWNRM
jgi:hypothetical protein